MPCMPGEYNSIWLLPGIEASLGFPPCGTLLRKVECTWLAALWPYVRKTSPTDSSSRRSTTQRQVGAPKWNLDVAGHSARPDLFRLPVSRDGHPMIGFAQPPKPEPQDKTE